MSTATLPDDPQIRARFGELKPALTMQAAVIEADRCLNCFDAPCTAACPTHIDVPGFIKRIASGNLRGSALRILDANILGASCARVCPVDVLCEGACVLHRQNRKPIQIALLQRHAMDAFWASGETPPAAAPGTRNLRVACIGGGPASLACAAELCREGARATVIERRALPGGLNTYGVAEYKLRATDSVREVELIRKLGVELRCGVEVDSAAALEALEKEFDFIFLGLGLGAMQRLNVPGEDAKGVMNALELIAAYKTGHLRELRGTVVVVGAGNTAIDAANAARRLGAEPVYLLYRRSENEISAFNFEYEHAKQEGVQFLWRRQPVAIRDGRARPAAARYGAGATSGPSTTAASQFATHVRLRPGGSGHRPVAAGGAFAGVAWRGGARWNNCGRSRDRADRQSALLCRRRLREWRARSGGCGSRRQTRRDCDFEVRGGGPCLTFACETLPAASTRPIRSGWPLRRPLTRAK